MWSVRARASPGTRLMRSQARAKEPTTPLAATMSALTSACSGSGRKAMASTIRARPCSMNAP
jgi:hypothetical protein